MSKISKMFEAKAVKETQITFGELPEDIKTAIGDNVSLDSIIDKVYKTETGYFVNLADEASIPLGLLAKFYTSIKDKRNVFVLHRKGKTRLLFE